MIWGYHYFWKHPYYDSTPSQYQDSNPHLSMNMKMDIFDLSWLKGVRRCSPHILLAFHLDLCPNTSCAWPQYPKTTREVIQGNVPVMLQSTSNQDVFCCFSTAFKTSIVVPIYQSIHHFTTFITRLPTIHSHNLGHPGFCWGQPHLMRLETLLHSIHLASSLQKFVGNVLEKTSKGHWMNGTAKKEKKLARRLARFEVWSMGTTWDPWSFHNILIYPFVCHITIVSFVYLH